MSNLTHEDSHSGDQTSDPFQHVSFIMYQVLKVSMIIGVLINLLAIVILYQMRQHGLIGPGPSFILLHQSFWDGLSCLLNVVVSFEWLQIRSDSSHAWNDIICHVWITEGLYYVTSTYGGFNHILLSLERLIAIGYPFDYMKETTRKTIVLSFYYTWPFISVFPSFFKKTYFPESFKCLEKSWFEQEHYLISFRTYTIFKIFNEHLAPMVFPIIFNTCTIIKIRQAEELSISHVDAKAQRGKASIALLKISFWITILFTAGVGYETYIHVVEGFRMIEKPLSALEHRLGFVLEQAGVAFNPLIYFFFLTSLRRQVFKLFGIDAGSAQMQSTIQ